jgi:hypothetical protein
MGMFAMQVFKVIVKPDGGPARASGFIRAKDEATARSILPSLPSLGFMPMSEGMRWFGAPDRLTHWVFGVDDEADALIERRARAVHGLEPEPRET